nr:hypothetical protein [Leptospira interrogans]
MEDKQKTKSYIERITIQTKPNDKPIPILY